MGPQAATAPTDEYGHVRLPMELLLRADHFIQASQEGFTSRAEVCKAALRAFLEAKEAQLARRQAWDAWVRDGKKGSPPEAPGLAFLDKQWASQVGEGARKGRRD